MGCYPLGKMMSKALRRRSGTPRSRVARTVVLTPPSTMYYGRAMANTVTFSDTNHVINMPPEHPQASPEPEQHPETAISPTPHTYRVTEEVTENSKNKEPKHVRFRDGSNSRGRVPHGSSQEEPEPVYSGPGLCYIASPLPGWEDEDRRRRDYFSREYLCYPTPIREGIYSIATDATRLTSMFSEENPNACNII